LRNFYHIIHHPAVITKNDAGPQPDTGGNDTDIDSVAFYADGSLLGSDDEPPFQWYWDTTSLADGEHTVTAVAAFSDGESVESEPVTVVVGDGGEVEPGLATGDNRSFEIAGVNFDMKYISVGITFLTGWDDNGDLNQFEVGVEVDPPEVTIENAYWVGETEVTFELWNTVYMWATGDTDRDGVISGSETPGNYTFSPGHRGGGFTPDSDQHPVTAVDWRDAIAWCNALTDYYNSQNGTQYGYVYCTDSSFSTPIRSVDNSSSVSYPNPGSQDDPYVNENAKGFRLPGLHEWGCAARYIGDFNQDGDITDSGEYYPGNFASGADADADTPQVEMDTDYDGDNDIEGWWDVAVLDVGVTSAVTSKSPNAIGLHDMTGNVLEWCFSWFPSREGEWRTARGGSWHNHFCSSEIGYVVPGGPHSAEDFLGFRIVKNE
jgi:formylglycine-generating enzyme required for sulfatase activity